MISVITLTFILKAFCGISTIKQYDTDKLKGDCFDYMLNCTIIYNKETTEELVSQCKEQWANKEIKYKRGEK